MEYAFWWLQWDCIQDLSPEDEDYCSIAYTYMLPSWFKALLLSLPYIVYSSSPLYFLSKSSILPPIVPKVLLHCAKIQKFALAQFSQISTRADYLNPLTSIRKIKMFWKVIDSSLKAYSWKMSSMHIVLSVLYIPSRIWMIWLEAGLLREVRRCCSSAVFWQIYNEEIFSLSFWSCS